MPSVVATTTISPQRTGAALVLNWTYVDGTTTIAIATNYLGTSQWLGIGLSLDDRMGNDHVFVCQRLSDDTIQLQRFINPNGHSYPTLMTADSNLGGIFQIKRIALNNGVAYCEFTLSNFINTADRRKKRSVSLLSQSTQYIVLVAIGSLDSSNSLVQHFLTHVLSQTIQLNQPGIITINNFEGSVVLIRAHGIIMLFIWMLCVSTSIILARYFKKSWPTRKICDKPIWFAIHRLVMTFAAIMTELLLILHDSTVLKYFNTTKDYLDGKCPDCAFMFKYVNMNIEKNKKDVCLQDFIIYLGELKGPKVSIETAAAKGNFILFTNELKPIKVLPLIQSIQLIDIIQYLYDCHVIHRDLVIENLMFDSHIQQLKLIDFGFATTYNINEMTKELSIEGRITFAGLQFLNFIIDLSSLNSLYSSVYDYERTFDLKCALNIIILKQKFQYMLIANNQNQTFEILKLQLFIELEKTKQIQTEEETKRKQLESLLIDQEESRKRLNIEAEQ
ncbi:unnamed protein product [Rotaria sp. Silwood1]|nr:unnamed protein product [Rotaria sp. Silwood1]